MTQNILCNKCGYSCCLTEHLENTGFQNYNSGLIDAQVLGGYMSTPGNGYGALSDGFKYTFSLCEFCLDELFENFTIPVKEEDYIEGSIVEWRSASKKIKEDEWRTFNPEYFHNESLKRRK